VDVKIHTLMMAPILIIVVNVNILVLIVNQVLKIVCPAIQQITEILNLIVIAKMVILKKLI